MDHPSYQLSGHAAKRIRSRKIELQWIAAALAAPDRVESDPQDTSVRHALKRIPQMQDRVLKVVYNFTVEPVRIVSVYFDRRWKDKL